MSNLERAIELKAELDSFRPLDKETEQRIMQKFRLDWNYHSNNIEGNTLTYGETKALILFNVTAQGKPLRDHFEIAGHDEAVKWVLEVVNGERKLTENFIRELHQLILKEPYEVDAITSEGKPTTKKVKVGEYKSTPNHVKTKSGEIFYFASVEETPAEMTELVNWFSQETANAQTDPILLATEFHYRFIRIHPFDDGNGRTARILMNFILLKNGYPPVVIKTEDKENYFRVLRLADAGDINPFLEYIAGNLCDSLGLMIAGAKGESIEGEDDVLKEIRLLKARINETADEVKIFKNVETIKVLLRKHLFNISNEFKSYMQEFDSLYLESDFFIKLNGTKIIQFDSNNEPIIPENSNDISSISLTYTFDKFKSVGFTPFNRGSLLKFSFQETEYLINGHHAKPLVKKLYHQELVPEDFQQVIKHEAKMHKRFLEQKLAEHKKSKS